MFIFSGGPETKASLSVKSVSLIVSVYFVLDYMIIILGLDYNCYLLNNHDAG